MRVRQILGAMMLAACGGDGGDGGPTGDGNISGVWAMTREGQSTSDIIAGTCTLSGTLSLIQAGNTASGTFDGPASCQTEIEEIGHNFENAPVENIQVDGKDISWNEHNCALSGEMQADDRIEGDIVCTTTYFDVPVTIEGTWQMSQWSHAA